MPDSPLHHFALIRSALREGKVEVQRLTQEEDWPHRAERELCRRPGYVLGSCPASARMHWLGQIQNREPIERRESLARLRFRPFQWLCEQVRSRLASILQISRPAEIRIALRATCHAEAKPGRTKIENRGESCDPRAACGMSLLTLPACPDRSAILLRAARKRAIVDSARPSRRTRPPTSLNK